tara:strand:+ start:7971 stop:8144 length:174 start_codon:yes stop_codon:yes gene_type:complete
MKHKIDLSKLKNKIKNGQSSRETAMQFGCSPTHIRRVAAEVGLKFNAKSNWKKYYES